MTICLMRHSTYLAIYSTALHSGKDFAVSFELCSLYSSTKPGFPLEIMASSNLSATSVSVRTSSFVLKVTF